MWARRVRHRAETAATRATRGWRGLTCGPVLSVGGARAERELGGETKQTERSVGERAASDAEGGPVAWERPRERRPRAGLRREERGNWAGVLGWVFLFYFFLLSYFKLTQTKPI